MKQPIFSDNVWILKSRDITLSTKVHLVKAMGFPVVRYRCVSWTIKKAEHDCSPLGSSVSGILQTIILEWVSRDLLKVFLIICFSLVSMILASCILKLIIRYIRV